MIKISLIALGTGITLFLVFLVRFIWFEFDLRNAIAYSLLASGAALFSGTLVCGIGDNQKVGPEEKGEIID